MAEAGWLPHSSNAADAAMEKKWASMPDEKTLNETAEAIRSRGIPVVIVGSGGEALAKIKQMIPAGAEVMNGSSVTLKQIGFLDYLKSGSHGWRNLHADVVAAKGKEELLRRRRMSILADFFLGSVNAIAKTGELVACDRTGSRIGAYPFAAKKLLLVSGAQKIVPTLDEALRRVREYVYPLEDQRARAAYGEPSAIGKCVIIAQEVYRERTTLILIRERLGF